MGKQLFVFTDCEICVCFSINKDMQLEINEYSKHFCVHFLSVFFSICPNHKKRRTIVKLGQKLLKTVNSQFQKKIRLHSRSCLADHFCFLYFIISIIRQKCKQLVNISILTGKNL